MKSQKGFTLIELIVVIVILGILAATALPKFVNMSGDARLAALKAIQGAATSAATLAYGKAAIGGVSLTTTGQSVTINGSAIALDYGYPTAASINTLLTDSGGATWASPTWTLQTNCTLTYVAAASSVAAPTFTSVTTGC